MNYTPAVLHADGHSRLAAAHILSACRPVETCNSWQIIEAGLQTPLEQAFSGLLVRTDIKVEGDFEGNRWVATSGHLHGRFVAPLFGIPAKGRIAHIRFGCLERVESGSVVETLLLLDLPSLMMQVGVWPLGPSLGPRPMAPGPQVAEPDGFQVDPRESAKSLALVEAMIGGLHRFEGDLSSMGMRSYWHEHFWWFGPDPIGSFCGHEDYERGHQKPFLSAFPDRVGGNHRARIASGSFVASGGWPSISATHSGGDWLGLAPTGRAITMRVMDFWRREGDLLAENWVMIDIPDLLAQMGIDVFARMSVMGETEYSPRRRSAKLV